MSKVMALSRFARVTVVALFMIASAAPVVGQTQPARNALVANAAVQGQQRLFSAWLDAQIAYRSLPGVVVGVVSDQDLLWAQGFGLANLTRRESMSPLTKFRMASHSKVFTATAIMQLRELGKLRLDDPVSQHLPWFNVLPAEPNAPPITIEELLTHISGLPREASAHWSTFEFPSNEELRALTPARQATFPSDVRWKYSNLAYALAGMVVEQVSGKPWGDYVRDHIFSPLGMTQSSVDQDLAGLAVGYSRRLPDGSRPAFPFVDARGMAAATGVTSTLEDMAKFVSAQFRTSPTEGAQVLSAHSLREMHRVRVLENNWTRGNAIGWQVTRVNNRTFIRHGGVYFGYGTETLIDVESKIGVIVLTNTNDSRPNEMAIQLMNTVGSAVRTAKVGEQKTIAWDPAWARFAGLYRSPFGDSHVVLLDSRLVMITPDGPNLDVVMSLEPIGDGRFKLVAPEGNVAVGETVRFVEEGGRVVRMITGDSYANRVGG